MHIEIFLFFLEKKKFFFIPKFNRTEKKEEDKI